MNPRELEQAIQDAFNGELDDARGSELREALRNSPEAVDTYCDQAILESELRRLPPGRRKAPKPVRARPLPRAIPRPRRRAPVFAIAAAAAVLLIVGMIWHRVFSTPDRILARLEITPGSAVLHGDGTAFRATGLEEDQAFVLGQGVASLRFKSGVEAVIEGPATVKLIDAGRLELRSGHSWFHVPHNARGFKVITDNFVVTDLGTEFGVDLREAHVPEIHVLKGETEVSANTGDRELVLLHAGEAVASAPSGTWTKLPADFHKFRSSLPKSIPSLKMDFDGIEDGNLSITGNILGAEGAVAKVIHPELVKVVPGIVGNAIQLHGDGASIETTWQGISGSNPRTVSLWCKLPKGTTFDTAPPLAWWGNPASGWNKKFKIAVITDKMGATVMRASFGQIMIDGQSNLADDAWHHLAVVYRGNQPDGKPDLAFFIDGAPEGISLIQSDSAPIETDSGSTNAGCLAIGKYELPASGRNPFLRATLDEFQIFAGALTESEIRDLAAHR